MSRFHAFRLIPLVFVLILAAACGFTATGSTTAQPLRIGVLPLVDALPLHVAVAEGYFERAGVRVELVPFASAIERDAAQQARQTDGQLADVLGPQLLSQGDDQMVIVHTLLGSTPERRLWGLVTGPGSRVNRPEDLRGARIAISHNTIQEYLTDSALRAAGIAPSEVQKVEVSRISLRAEMVGANQVEAAALLEPLHSLVVQQGGRVVLDDRAGLGGVIVVALREAVAEARQDEVRRMLQALNQAAEAINRDPERYRPLLIERANLPDALRTTFQIPQFPVGQVPGPDIVEPAQRWMLEKGLLQTAAPYTRIVRPLPAR